MKASIIIAATALFFSVSAFSQTGGGSGGGTTGTGSGILNTTSPPGTNSATPGALNSNGTINTGMLNNSNATPLNQQGTLNNTNGLQNYNLQNNNNGVTNGSSTPGMGNTNSTLNPLSPESSTGSGMKPNTNLNSNLNNGTNPNTNANLNNGLNNNTNTGTNSSSKVLRGDSTLRN